ncbi:hypothetical protein R6Q57_006567 [Mikania cordata]
MNGDLQVMMRVMKNQNLILAMNGDLQVMWKVMKNRNEKTGEDARTRITESLKRHEEAIEHKSKILDIIRTFDLPYNPLDELIDQLGGPDNVAEITGRRGMLDSSYQAFKIMYQAFKIKSHTLLFTNLGGECRFASSVSKRLASLGAVTQGDRRAGPSLGAYNYDSGYGKKALSILYSGILAQGSLPVVPPNCSSENPATIHDFIQKGQVALESIGLVGDRLGITFSQHTCFVVFSYTYTHDVRRFLNRILGLPPEIQNRLCFLIFKFWFFLWSLIVVIGICRLFEFFISILDHLLHKARLEGLLDTGIVDLKANTIELQGSPKIVHTDHMSGASTLLFTFRMDRGITWEAASLLLNENEQDLSNGFYESKREWLGRRHFLLAIEGSFGTFKIFRPATGETLREFSTTELKEKYRKIVSLEKARSGWKDEYEVSSKQCMHGPNCKLRSFCTVGRSIQEVNVLGGLILPLWGTIQKALSKQNRPSHKRIRVVGIQTTTDDQRIVGLLVPNAAVESVLQDLAWVQDKETTMTK